MPSAADATTAEPAAPPHAAARRAVVVLAAAAAPLICVGAAQALPVPTLGAPSDNGFSSGTQAAAMGQAALYRASSALPTTRGADAPDPAADFALPVETMQTISPLTNGNLAGHAAQNLSDGADAMVGRVSGPLPVQQPAPQLAQDSHGAVRVAPGLLGAGPLGGLSQNLAPQARALTGTLAAQSAPLVDELRQDDLPTVGDVSGSVANSPLPGYGTVHGLTGSLPVATMLDSSDLMTGALDNVSAL